MYSSTESPPVRPAATPACAAAVTVRLRMYSPVVFTQFSSNIKSAISRR
jgi:hypothetical protein